MRGYCNLWWRADWDRRLYWRSSVARKEKIRRSSCSRYNVDTNLELCVCSRQISFRKPFWGNLLRETFLSGQIGFPNLYFEVSKFFYWHQRMRKETNLAKIDFYWQIGFLKQSIRLGLAITVGRARLLQEMGPSPSAVIYSQTELAWALVHSKELTQNLRVNDNWRQQRAAHSAPNFWNVTTNKFTIKPRSWTFYRMKHTERFNFAWVFGLDCTRRGLDRYCDLMPTMKLLARPKRWNQCETTAGSVMVTPK